MAEGRAPGGLIRARVLAAAPAEPAEGTRPTRAASGSGREGGRRPRPGADLRAGVQSQNTREGQSWFGAHVAVTLGLVPSSLPRACRHRSAASSARWAAAVTRAVCRCQPCRGRPLAVVEPEVVLRVSECLFDAPAQADVAPATVGFVAKAIPSRTGALVRRAPHQARGRSSRCSTSARPRRPVWAAKAPTRQVSPPPAARCRRAAMITGADPPTRRRGPSRKTAAPRSGGISSTACTGRRATSEPPLRVHGSPSGPGRAFEHLRPTPSPASPGIRHAVEERP